MKTIRTVTGCISSAAMGHCQMHEHLYVAAGPATKKLPALLIDDPERSALELNAYGRAGGGCIVDAQPGGAGRDVRVLRQISLRSGVSIIASTGYHLPHFYPADHWALSADVGELEARFCGELFGGCEETREIFPGVVKAALSANGCRGVEKMRFMAAAKAAARASVPLLVHTEKGFDAAAAVDIAQSCGVPVHRILICHADRQTTDWALHDAIARTGAMLEYDTIGRFKYHDDESEIRLIQHLLDRGHGEQLLLSLDTTRERLESYGGAVGLTYLFDRFLPALVNAGISEKTFRSIMADNPRRVFED